MNAPVPRPLGWLGIIRLGLVQTSLGAIVVLTTSTLNRIMVVELALPAVLPGFLVGLHYGLQVLRPRWGHGSDSGGRRTPWILGGMAVLATGGALAAAAVALMGTALVAGIVLGLLAFTLIGLGVGASGTSLLVLLAERTADARRPAAATVVWLMMIAGFVLTATLAGRWLDPYSPARLLAVSAVVSALAMAVTLVAVLGLEGPSRPRVAPAAADPPFRAVLAQVWGERRARRFTLFVFVSMLAYSAQDLILEPFAGAVFGMTPGESTRLGGLQHMGVFLGMLLVPLVGALTGARGTGTLRGWMIGGCLASAVLLAAIAQGGLRPEGFPLKPLVVLLGVANGAFAVAAIGAMMGMAVEERGEKTGRNGTRMGLWGAAQAVAFGLGGFFGTLAIDAARLVIADPAEAYRAVFLGEACLFVASAVLAGWITLADRAAAGRAAALRPATLQPGE